MPLPSNVRGIQTDAQALLRYEINSIKMPSPIILRYSQLWGTASTSNIEILERFESKALRIMVDAPWYVPNNHIRRDLQMPSDKEEICRYSNHIALVSPHIQMTKY
jgi:hypothetical protein